MGAVDTVGFSTDSKHAVSGSEDGSLRIWDLEKKILVAGFHGDAAVSSWSWVLNRIVVGDEGGQVHILAWEQ
jgi:WD40 repeat protein